MANTHDIGDIIISARPFSDYLAQFALTEGDLLNGAILDCPGGASDFAAKIRVMGGTAVSVDPWYQQSHRALMQRINQDLERVKQWTASQPDRFPLDENGVWHDFHIWQSTAHAFLADIKRDRNEDTGYYLSATLPKLPFPEQRFALAVSGFLLFTYPQHFDLAFHRQAIHELLRVAREVRLHPLNDSAQNPYPELSNLLEQLDSDGIVAEFLTVPGQSDVRDTQTLCLKRC